MSSVCSAAVKKLPTHIKPFCEIPGPKSLPVIGTLWSYLPFIGQYKFDSLHLNGIKKLKKYGPVIKEEIIPGENLVFIFKPEDIQEMFKKDGRYPQRRSHLALQHIRLKKPDVYNTGGLLPTNGEDWLRLRSNFQKALSTPANVKKFIPKVNTVLDDFVVHISKTHNPHAPGDFLQDLSRVFLELLGVVAFNRRLNSFDDKELEPNSRTSELIGVALEANSSILKTDINLLWKFFPTPLYRKLKKAHDHMERVAVEELRKMNHSKGDDPVTSIMESYLQCPHVDHKDVVGMAVDMILAGTDTTSYTTSFILYHLARNPDKQEKLYEEIKNVLGVKKAAGEEELAQCKYTKAVIKESLRMNPVSVGVSRLLSEDAIFSDYHVPKGTTVITQNQVSCRSDQYFKDPDLFLPERWLKDHPSFQPVHPHLLLPFGHGPRTCIARRLAEQNIQLLVIKIIQNFSLKWHGGDLDIRTLLINKPDGPISVSLTKRN